MDKIALFLDFDGTLVEIAERPNAVTVPPDLPDLLERLIGSLDGAMAVVSGRTVAALDGFLRPARFAAAGSHGAEMRLSPDAEIQHLGFSLPGDLRAALTALAAKWQTRWPGIEIEDKGVALALHYRRAPEAEPTIRSDLGNLATDEGWRIIDGHCVFEIKSATLSKGSAVRALMNVPEFRGRSAIVVGDDRTDLDGMEAALALGGAGLVVGDLVDELAAEQATWSLSGPAAVRDWLSGLLSA